MKIPKYIPNFTFCIVFSLLSGCASFDRLGMSSFEPFTSNTGQEMFRFRADTTSVSYPTNTAEGEAVRIGWLEEYLKLNNMCPQGYEIIERKAVVRAETFAGPAHTIYYIGRCVDEPSTK
jgi:hypothetical protein